MYVWVGDNEAVWEWSVFTLINYINTVRQLLWLWSALWASQKLGPNTPVNQLSPVYTNLNPETKKKWRKRAAKWFIYFPRMKQTSPGQSGELSLIVIPLSSDSPPTTSPPTLPLHPLDNYYSPPLHTHTHLCTHAPLVHYWICKSTSAPAPNLQPSPCVWYANAVNRVFFLPSFPPHLPILSPSLCFLSSALTYRSLPTWVDDTEETEGRATAKRREGLQTKPDNDVVMDGCYTHKQACEQQWEARLIREQWREIQKKGCWEWEEGQSSILWHSLYFLPLCSRPAQQRLPWQHIYSNEHRECHTADTFNTAAAASVQLCELVSKSCIWTLTNTTHSHGGVLMHGVPFRGHCSQSKAWSALWFIKDEMGWDLFPGDPHLAVLTAFAALNEFWVNIWMLKDTMGLWFAGSLWDHTSSDRAVLKKCRITEGLGMLLGCILVSVTSHLVSFVSSKHLASLLS